MPRNKQLSRHVSSGEFGDDVAHVTNNGTFHNRGQGDSFSLDPAADHVDTYSVGDERSPFPPDGWCGNNGWGNVGGKRGKKK